MARNEEQSMQRISPLGTALWPKLNEPDTKFKATGEYKVTLTWYEDDDEYEAAKALIAELDEFCEQCCVQFDEDTQEEYEKALKKAKGGKKPKQPEPGKRQQKGWGEKEDDDGKPYLYITFKMNATYEKDGETKTMRPALFDGKNKKIDHKKVKIGNGSKLEVGFKADFYATAQGIGLTMRLEAVRVISLVAFGGERTAERYGFGAARDDGYDSSQDESEGDENDGGSSGKGSREVDLDNDASGDGDEDGYKDS